MKYKLINEPNDKFSTIEQILFNRGISEKDIPAYLHTSDNDINNYYLLGKKQLQTAGEAIKTAIEKKEKMLIIIDCDCDGYTSSALFINYLYNINKDYVLDYVTWWHHSGKQHGLSDCCEIAKNYNIVICPDASSNDYDQHKILRELGIPVVVLDHHEADVISSDAIIINNQLSDYPNKAFSGVGIVWQFCRYLDENVFYTNYAEKYIDLVALGLVGDVMSLRSIETKHLINKGFKEDSIKNPFLYYMAQKNAYSIGDHITPIGAAFYIVPFVNAVVRSGTQQEKELIFNSMLNFKAFDIIPSTKRGCKGQTEKLVEQAIRTAVNVKARQTREQDKAMELLEKRIDEEHLLDHQVLLFLLQPGEIAPGLAGLIANKIMAKYQRPCCILTESEEGIYQGSARGYSKSGIESFKAICEQSDIVFAEGHAHAHGLGIRKDKIQNFLEDTDKALKDMEKEPLFYVDFEWKGTNIDKDKILDIGSAGQDLWGQDVDEPFVAVKKLNVSKSQVSVYRKKDNTIKISTPAGVDLMIFKATEAQCELFTSNEAVVITLVGRCNENVWMGKVTPQIFIEDYQVEEIKQYDF